MAIEGDKSIDCKEDEKDKSIRGRSCANTTGMHFPFGYTPAALDPLP
jgi:hypothetical protein